MWCRGVNYFCKLIFPSIIYYIRERIVKLLMYILGKGFCSSHVYGMSEESLSKLGIDFNYSKTNIFFQNIFYYLVYLRLLILKEPYIFIILNLALTYFLLFNKKGNEYYCCSFE